MELINPKKTYETTDYIVHSCQYHVLFCSKWRRKVLTETIANHLRTLIEEKQQEYGYRILSMDISIDHVHLILETVPDAAIGVVVGRIKAYTSHVLRRSYQELRSRIPTLWTRVSFVSSIGNVALNDLETFLEAQRKN